MRSQFSAQEPSLGYHYQIRYALYLLLKAKEKNDPFIKLENLDDVEVGAINEIELYQTKFHKNKIANLTDASVDIWKTIRVWSEIIINETIDVDSAILVLVTTSETSPNSILYELTENRTGSKTILDIIKKLNEVASTSTNRELKEAFEVYKKLKDEQKEKLVKSIYIRDRALGFDELKRKITDEIKIFLLPEQLESAFQDLQGWWYEQCIQHLENSKDKITYQEVCNFIRYFIDKQKSDNLQVDMNIAQAEISEEDYNEMSFVKQLKEINLGKHSITQAKRDYYRANEQRSKWIREQLLNPQEEIDYDFKLKDDWQGKFAFLQDEIESEANEIVKEKCLHFYTSYYGTSYPNIFIRPRVTDIFVVKGSCQMLADKKDIAWHPNYLKI
ncbi:hypothetical protein GO730_19410 [Spirosoma sp. HMF3257]|uniref:ABC-three component systems C-terminal domain-containing protein n=1 Tax=Spirosoma telluris TaxID=2183553 RepID=A0A327NKR7_9BACT|nr:hypothetical protein [Spirosoma telluris]RAI75772.1 hypothetical protein HMF3257_19340 [Spirosoma telluris]